MDHSTSEHGDLKVVCPVDCGNAPKKSFLKELHIAFATNNIIFIIENITEGCTWDIVGDTCIKGKDDISDFLNQTSKVSELQISTIITHGNTASVNGSFLLRNKKRFAFCHVYKFTSAGKNSKLKEITTYTIETTSSHSSFFHQIS